MSNRVKNTNKNNGKWCCGKFKKIDCQKKLLLKKKRQQWKQSGKIPTVDKYFFDIFVTKNGSIATLIRVRLIKPADLQKKKKYIQSFC